MLEEEDIEMKIVRPFDASTLGAGEAGEWLLRPDEDEGVAVRLRRGGGAPAPLEGFPLERFAIVLEGEVVLATSGASETAGPGEILFIPAGSEASIEGSSDAIWADIEAPVAPMDRGMNDCRPAIIRIDKSRFSGGGFAYQSLVDRSVGARALRINLMQVQPGAGSPDWHIHAFAQMYIILDGEMTLDVGRRRLKAPKNSLVVLPAGVVHRNFNAAAEEERHISLLVPEPAEGQIFDYAVTIHETEAELLTAVPA